ncbi:hypothetical protein [Kordia sp.]|uniref:hypothetical protein n=1 Tax=Kordia sp. TaxID=1965332 RepID=UPI003D6B8BD4
MEQEKRFRLLSTPKKHKVKPFTGIPLARKDVLGIIGMDEIHQIDTELKQAAEDNLEGYARSVILVDYITNSIFFIMDGAKENMIYPEDWETSLFKPINEFKTQYYTSETDYLEEEDIKEALKDKLYYVITLFDHFSWSPDKSKNRASLEHYLSFLEQGKTLVRNFSIKKTD